MKQAPELEYFCRVLRRLRLQTLHFDPQSPGPALPEFLQDAPDWAKPNTIYKLADPFQRRYIYFLLPQGGSLLIGPWLDREKSRENLLEEAERLALPAARAAQLEQLYAEIPVVTDPTNLFAMVNVLGETLWGAGTAFSILDVTKTEAEPLLPPEARPQEELLGHMRQIEARYSHENELMETVTQGLEHRAELMLRGFSRHTLEQRTADPLRNIKNYCIVCNTLLRKAAEKGGVHPAELDRISSRMARRIEEQGTPEQALDLMRDMVRAYCRLVRRHTEGDFSPFVRRIVAYIESDPAADLSLHALAGLLKVNASYLSTLFRRETGRTVTEFVNATRMETAARLLRTTHLQIQTVAQHCGMSDLNYFSKLFKKHHGITPRQYRALWLPASLP